MAARPIALTVDPGGSHLPGPFLIEIRGERPLLHLTFRDLMVDREDVVSVREAFEESSPDELLSAVLRHEAGWRITADALESRTYAMLMRKVTDGLDVMMRIESKPANGDRERVIGPCWSFVEERDGQGLLYGMGAALYDRDDVGAVRDILRSGVGRALTWKDLQEARRLFHRRVGPEVAGHNALRRSIARLSTMTWEEALAMPLWSPKGLSDQERYAMLAKVFWAMTYSGFTPEERDRAGSGYRGGGCRDGRSSVEEAPPNDPVRALLQHACWIDALEMQDALFAVLSSKRASS